MNDGVVPAPDCLATLMGHDLPAMLCVREDTAGRLVEKAALRFDLKDPRAIKPKTAMVETTYVARAAMPPLVTLENVAFEGFMVRRDVVAAVESTGRELLHLLRRRRLRDPDPAGRIHHPRGARRRPGQAAGLQPAARPVGLEGLLHVSQPLRGALPVRRERAGPRQSPT